MVLPEIILGLDFLTKTQLPNLMTSERMPKIIWKKQRSCNGQNSAHLFKIWIRLNVASRSVQNGFLCTFPQRPYILLRIVSQPSQNISSVGIDFDYLSAAFHAILSSYAHPLLKLKRAVFPVLFGKKLHVEKNR